MQGTAWSLNLQTIIKASKLINKRFNVERFVMRRTFAMITVSLFVLFNAPVWAVDASDVPEEKQTELGLYLSPQEAWDMIQESPDDVLFLDVRTRGEATYVGMPTDADALVPFVDVDPFGTWDDKRNTYKVEPVQEFVPEANRRLADKGLDKNSKVLVMCRSGTRSAMAADRLAKDGYTQVYSVVEGFEGDTAKSGPNKGQRIVNGWKNAGLPWSYKLDKSKMFLQEP